MCMRSKSEAATARHADAARGGEEEEEDEEDEERIMLQVTELREDRRQYPQARKHEGREEETPLQY